MLSSFFFSLGILSLGPLTSIPLFTSLLLAFCEALVLVADAFQLLSVLCCLSQATVESFARCWPGTGEAAPGCSLPRQFFCLPVFYLQWWQCREASWGAALPNRCTTKRSCFRKALLLIIKTAWALASPGLACWVIKGKCTKCHHCHDKFN